MKIYATGTLLIVAGAITALVIAINHQQREHIGILILAIAAILTGFIIQVIALYRNRPSKYIPKRFNHPKPH